MKKKLNSEKLSYKERKALWRTLFILQQKVNSFVCREVVHCEVPPQQWTYEILTQYVSPSSLLSLDISKLPLSLSDQSAVEIAYRECLNQFEVLCRCLRIPGGSIWEGGSDKRALSHIARPLLEAVLFAACSCSDDLSVACDVVVDTPVVVG